MVAEIIWPVLRIECSNGRSAARSEREQARGAREQRRGGQRQRQVDAHRVADDADGDAREGVQAEVGQLIGQPEKP